MEFEKGFLYNIIILKILKISKYVPLAATNFSKIDPSQRVYAVKHNT